VNPFGPAALTGLIALLLCGSPCHGLTLRFIPTVGSRHSIGNPIELGWGVELTYTFDHSGAWAGLHYSLTNGKAEYLDKGFNIHDTNERIGLSGGREWLLGNAWIVQTGVHADLLIMRRSMIGNPSSWAATYNAHGLGCGLSGRLIRRMGELTAISLGLYPGHSFVFQQEFHPSTANGSRPIENAPYLGFSLGLVLQLASAER
jgi:hypothetical protein